MSIKYNGLLDSFEISDPPIYFTDNSKVNENLLRQNSRLNHSLSKIYIEIMRDMSNFKAEMERLPRNHINDMARSFLRGKVGALFNLAEYVNKEIESQEK